MEGSHLFPEAPVLNVNDVYKSLNSYSPQQCLAFEQTTRPQGFSTTTYNVDMMIQKSAYGHISQAIRISEADS